MKKIILLLLISGMALTAYSQIHFGLTTAVNSSFVLDKGITSDPRYNSKMTYEFAPIGFSFGVNLGKKFGLQLETIMANQGQIFEVIDAAKTAVGERKIDLSYIQIPLLFKFMNGGNAGARTNFSLGPQLSLLRQGSETLQYIQSVMTIPDEYASYNGDQAGTYTITDPSTGDVLTTEATLNSEGKYNVPAMPSKELLSSKMDDMKNKEFQIAASFGLDIDLGKHLYLTSLIRANYSLTDMRNGDVIDSIKDENDVKNMFSKRSSVLVGVQLGLSYIIGGTRSFKE